MESSFWRERWQEGKIGFHEGKPNTFLAEHLGRVSGRRVFVPLCGKTEDLAYLAAQGRDVVGVELVEDAVRAYFAEHAIEPQVRAHGEITAYTAGPLTILAGDLFAVTPKLVGPIDAIYDRAALIALPQEMRATYIAHVRALAGVNTPVLLVALEYPQDQMEGPPFSVSDPEVRTHYHDVTLLGERPATSGKVGELGTAVERCYLAAL